jgi:hypothetical protein
MGGIEIEEGEFVGAWSDRIRELRPTSRLHLDTSFLNVRL